MSDTVWALKLDGLKAKTPNQLILKLGLDKSPQQLLGHLDGPPDDSGTLSEQLSSEGKHS